MDSTRARPLKVGVLLPQIEGMMPGGTARWSDLLAIARAAEVTGFDSLWLIDHLLLEPPEPGGPALGCWECGSLLAALAAATRRVELGTWVVNTGYRNPALLAKVADCVEEISGGRLILRLGAGAMSSSTAPSATHGRTGPAVSRRLCRSSCRCSARGGPTSRERTTESASARRGRTGRVRRDRPWSCGPSTSLGCG
jgi:hypothetical protein